MINTFDELLAHAGHETETVYYGTDNQAVNASIECITCGCVLVDLSPGDLLSKELAEDVKQVTVTATEEMIDAWVGNQGYAGKRDEWMLKTIKEIANGEYTAEQLNNDIVEYWSQ
jgi:hypothetical protein